MANIDAPRGFKPVGTLHGGDPVAHEYVVTAGQVIYRGDPVIMTTAGTISIAAAASSTLILGISAEWITTAATGKTCMIYDDPDTLFEVQMTTGITASLANCVFATSDIVTYATGNTTTGLSIMELDTPGTSSLPWLILRLSPSPDNAWGEHAKVICLPNAHAFKAVYAGLA